MYKRTLVVAVTLVLLGSVFVPPVAGATAVEEPDEPVVHVDVAANGDVTISLVSVHDLDDDDEQEAFDSLQDDDDAQEELRDRFTDRMKSVADTAGDDGETVLTDESIELRSGDGYGIVILSVTWDGLAAGDGETLVLTEPFASGFEPDRQLVVTGPVGSTIESTSHEPAEVDDVRASWEPGTDLEGFELVFSLDASEHESGDGTSSADDTSSTDDTSSGDDEASDGLPGFGAGVALVALLAVCGIASQRTQ